MPEEISKLPVPIVKESLVVQKADNKEISFKDYIKPTMIRYPTYSYQTGTMMYLSKKQQIVVDAYLETHNIYAAARTYNALAAKHGAHQYSMGAVVKWFAKPHVMLHIGQKEVEKGKVNWMDQAHWEAWGVDAIEGKTAPTKIQLGAWKEYGKHKGWSALAQPAIQHNTQINFTQSDGKT